MSQLPPGSIIESLRTFIELSQSEGDRPWQEWIDRTVKSIETRCWERKRCGKTDCPAYQNRCGRCWLIAGTLCGECAEGVFARKYQACTRCDLFQEMVYRDPETELRELIIILIYSLRSRTFDLREAQQRIRVLSGMLPICAHCKRIRGEEGSWHQMESYITRQSGALFTHGLCPDCAGHYFPGSSPPSIGT